MNWYAYCGSNPLNCTDPTGLFADTNDSNNSNDAIESEEEKYNPYTTDCHKFIETLIAMAKYYRSQNWHLELAGDIADTTIIVGTSPELRAIRSVLGGNGESNYSIPTGTSGFRSVLTQGGQNAQAYRHVGAAAAAALAGKDLLIQAANWRDRRDLADSRAKWEAEEDEDRKQQLWDEEVLEDYASLYGNEAGRIVGNALQQFMSGSMNSGTLGRQLIGILGDDQMRKYFGVRQTLLYIQE
jgi:hypothetical protein